MRLPRTARLGSTIAEQCIADELQYPDMPDPDLLVRTGGEQRLSNLLLWRAADAELVFTDVLWPDFGYEHLLEAVTTYRARQRRFGAIADR